MRHGVLLGALAYRLNVCICTLIPRGSHALPSALAIVLS